MSRPLKVGDIVRHTVWHSTWRLLADPQEPSTYVELLDGVCWVPGVSIGFRARARTSSLVLIEYTLAEKISAILLNDLTQD